MPPQVTRLAIAFAFAIAGFMVFRYAITPAGFGSEGFHRKEGTALVASREMKHAGRKACLQCHGEKAETTAHFKAGVGCETCHGAAKTHADDPDKTKPFVPGERKDCTRCHAMLVGRPMIVPQISPEDHHKGEKCMSCHAIHGGEEPK